jgi:TonB-linked SusC/RagA family outer membrane protein
MMMMKHICKRFFLLLAVVITATTIHAQNEFKIKGRVLSKGNTPVADVAVSLEGVRVDVVLTDSIGQFEISSPNGEKWLLFSPIGDFKRKRVFVNNRNELVVYLQNADGQSKYDEIRTPVGNEIKRNSLSAFRDLDVDLLQSLPFQSVDQFLQGRVAGLQVTNHSGMPGEGTYINLRGLNSRNSNAQPLFIIDGVMMESPGIFNSIIDGSNYNPLSTLDPQDITNIVVYKDALASSLFGMKGSNGVVVIETLQPTEIKTTIDMNLRRGMSFEPRQLPVLNSNQFRTLGQEILASSPLLEENFLTDYPGLFDDVYSPSYFRYNNNTNWQDIVFRTGQLTDFYFKVRGGDEIAKYGLSVGFLNHDNIIENSDFTRTTIRFVGDFNVTSWARIYLSSSFGYNITNSAETGTTVQTSPILTSMFRSPLMHPYQFDEFGRELVFLDEVGEFGISNPQAVIKGFEGRNDNYRLVTSFRLELDINKNLQFSNLLGVNFNSSNELVFQPNIGVADYFDGEVWNTLKNQSSIYFALNNDSRINYTKTFLGIHRVYGSAGLRVQTNDYTSNNAIAKNLNENDQDRSQGSNTLAEIGGNTGNWNWLSLYANALYDYKDKYLLGVSLSFDGSTLVGKDAETSIKLGGVPFVTLPSVSAGWRVSNENFLKNVSWIEELKVRATYGLSGNDQIGYINALAYYQPVLYRQTSGAILGNIANTTLKNETTVKQNVGIDFSILGERFSASFDIFENEVRDMLIFERQNPYIGYQFRPTNGASMINKGYELSLNARIIKTRDLKWDVGGNISHYSNEMLSVIGGSLIREIPGGEVITSVGNPMNAFYGLQADGVYETSEAASVAGLLNDRGIPYGAGDMRFNDISGPNGTPDGVINKFDKTIIGNPNPDFYGGIYSTLKYKRWTLDLLFSYVLGNDVFNYLRYQTEKMTDLSNQSSATLNRWQHEGQVTNVPRALWNDYMGNAYFSSRWIEDGSFIKLSNATLAYNVPDGVTLWGLDMFRSAKIYVTGTNLLTLTKYLGYNPEFSNTYNPLLQGVDYGQVPVTSSFIVGIKLGL